MERNKRVITNIKRMSVVCLLLLLAVGCAEKSDTTDRLQAVTQANGGTAAVDPDAIAEEAIWDSNRESAADTAAGLDDAVAGIDDVVVGAAGHGVAEQIEEQPTPVDGIDVDLTQLSSTVVFAEVYNMMMAPEGYIGKTVRMKGQFTVFPSGDPEVGNYYAVMIADAAACCQQGFEFFWSGDHQYPEDYPPEGTEIMVTGVFESFHEGQYEVRRLVTDEIVICE